MPRMFGIEDTKKNDKKTACPKYFAHTKIIKVVYILKYFTCASIAVKHKVVIIISRLPRIRLID